MYYMKLFEWSIYKLYIHYYILISICIMDYILKHFISIYQGWANFSEEGPHPEIKKI